jgi:hypothetical protein
VPDRAGEAIHPEEAEDGADSDGNETHEDTALAHAVEKIKRGKAPEQASDFVFLEQALLGEIDDAEDAREAEGGISQNAEGYVKGEGDSFGGDGGGVIGRGDVGEKEEGQDERKDQGAYGALAVENLQAEVGEGEEPSEKGHGAGEVVIRNGVEAAGTFEKCKVVSGKACRQEDGADAAGPFAASDQIAYVAREAAHIRRKCKQEKEMGHGLGPGWLRGLAMRRGLNTPTRV